MRARLVRSRELILVQERGKVRIIVPGRTELVFGGRAGAVVTELLNEVSSESGRVAPSPRLLDLLDRTPEIVDALLGAGALREEDDQGEMQFSVRSLTPTANVLLGSCGAMDAFRLPDYADQLMNVPGWNVQVVLTAAAEHFVSVEVLERLTGAPVHRELFSDAARHRALHINLANWADIIVVLPATANFLSRIAAGLYNDLLSATVAAADCPIALFPSMNPAMWKRRAVQRNLDLLGEEGMAVVHPAAANEIAGNRDNVVLGGTGVRAEHLPALIDQFLVGRTKE